MAKLVDIQVSIAGTAEVAAAFEEVGSSVRERVKEAVLGSARDLRAATIAGALSGGMLQQRSGQLKRRMRVRAYERPNRISADVYSDATHNSPGYAKGRYGFILAAGAHKPRAKVGGYVRRYTPHGVAAGFESRDVYGSPGLRKRGKPRKARKLAQGIQFVKAHTRAIELRPRPFIAATMEPMRGAIEQRIVDAVEAATLERAGFGNVEGGGI